MIEEILEKLQAFAPSNGGLYGWTEEQAAVRLHRFQQLRLQAEHVSRRLLPLRRRLRVASTACWEFPIYSQTFVYQELTELARAGFDLRFLYSKLTSRTNLPSHLSRVWRCKRKVVLHAAVCEADYAYYKVRMPQRVKRLVARICDATGMPEHDLQRHYHFRQAFAFTRTVEACRPDYLHSYFFYEGTLFTLVASCLLDIPRGVSCYTDHMLQDYALKLVPLHLEQCSIVVATSARIKRELLQIAPNTDPERILVKPNAIDSRRFAVVERPEPAVGQPFRITCVSRIEPKKGIVYLADAVRRLLDAGVNVSVHVLGGVDQQSAFREYAQTVESRIAKLGVGHALKLEGTCSAGEVRRCLEESHLFVAPFIETDTGDKDGIPTALLEAMASGLPVVATDAGSISEVVTGRREGLLVEQRNGAALADAIRSLLGSPETRRRMGAEAAATARRSFDVGVCERRFHDRIRSATATQRQGWPC
jgi:glycosyltransferase involved in cell wall biosynthesis